MDPVTHTLTGAALSGAGLKRTTPLATVTLVVAANAPDVDILSYMEGSYAALAFRRGVTHGIPALLVLPLAVAAAILAGDRWIRRRRWPEAAPARPGVILGLSYLGVATHPVLDWMNTYGMRWLLPIDGRWSYGDALFIIDPWIWLALGGTLFLAHSKEWTSLAGWALFGTAATGLILTAPVPGGAKALWCAGLGILAMLRIRGGARDPNVEERRVRWGVTAAALYVAAMAVADPLARGEVLRAAESKGVGPVEEVMVAPLPAHPLRGQVVVRTPEGDLPGEFRWGERPRVRLHLAEGIPRRHGVGLGEEAVDRAVRAASRSPEAADYLVWSRLPRYRVHATDGGYRVRITDARYAGRGAGSLGGITVELDEELRPISGSSRRRGQNERERNE